MAKALPKTFSEFRLLIGNNCRLVGGVPAEFVDEILDLDFEGSGVAAALQCRWEQFEADLNDDGFSDGDLLISLRDQVFEAVLEAAEQYHDPDNYHPGRKVQHFEALPVADGAAAIITRPARPQY